MYLFDRIPWRDPVSGRKLTARVACRDPAGRPLSGALVIEGTNFAYPIAHGIPRLSPELAQRHRAWLEADGLVPPAAPTDKAVQEESTVASFGTQWEWDSEPRTEEDLRWRVAERHALSRSDYANRVVLDAGAGAGDQSRWILQGGADAVVSVDLSDAINVAYRKLWERPNWIGIQGDIAALPFADSFFEFVYCEGVIQHTQSSQETVKELVRVLANGGQGVATHYTLPESLKLRAQLVLRNWLRARLSGLDFYKLLFASGVLASTAHIPVVGSFFGKTIALKNARMPTFKSTWCATYDAYGGHAYQRHPTMEEVLSYFELPGIISGPTPGGGIAFKKK
jgi:ubiquinone/menaquinone biosynthesis C-methylase UbiE